MRVGLFGIYMRTRKTNAGQADGYNVVIHPRSPEGSTPKKRRQQLQFGADNPHADTLKWKYLTLVVNAFGSLRFVGKFRETERKIIFQMSSTPH